MTAGLSAFAAVQHLKKPPAPPSTSSLSNTSSTSSILDRDRDEDEDDDEVDVADNTLLPAEPRSVLSDKTANVLSITESIRPIGRDSIAVRLEKDQNLAVVGVFCLWVKRGRVSLWGALLEASSTLHHVFVPITHAVPCITSTGDCAEVILSPDSSNIRYLGDVAPHFSGIWSPAAANPQLPFHVLNHHSRSSQDVSPEPRYLALDPWLSSIQAITQTPQTPRVLVAGARKTGKSTLCRCLVNTLLTAKRHEDQRSTSWSNDGVMLLDLDPGQPDLAPPGMLYLAHIRTPLLGPSFTSFILPETAGNTMLRMHYIGAYSPRESPSHFMRCVQDLWSLYSQYQHLPLIINTCGWTTGAGKDILLSLLRTISLTHLLYLADGSTSPWCDASFTDLQGQQKPVTLLPCQSNHNRIRSGRDIREMQIQAYLHALGFANDRIVWDQIPIFPSLGPAEMAWDLWNETPLIVILGDDVSPEYVPDALRNSLAAIVVVKQASPINHLSSSPEPGASQDEGQQQMHVAYTSQGQIPYLVYDHRSTNPLDPTTTECIGLGLVSVTLSAKSRFRVRSPVPSANIEAHLTKGHRVALVVAKQRDSWTSLEEGH